MEIKIYQDQCVNGQYKIRIVGLPKQFIISSYYDDNEIEFQSIESVNFIVDEKKSDD